MTILAKLGGIALGLACMIGTAYAVDADQVRVDPNKGQFQTVYGNTLPPIGHVAICTREPKEFRATASNPLHLHLTPDRCNLV